MQAWLRQDAQTFPLMYAQAIVSIVRNDEEFQLRFLAVDIMIDMCNRAPKVAAQVGAIKLLIDCLMDLTLDGYRYDRISHNLMMLINEPDIRVYIRPFIDLNKIFATFTRSDGVDSDPKKPVMERIEA